MADERLDKLIGSLPVVDGPAVGEAIDAITAAYVDQALRKQNPALYSRIHATIGDLYLEVARHPNLQIDPSDHLVISADQLQGIIALSVVRGAAGVILDIAQPLRDVEELRTLLGVSIEELG